jgi:P-type conjugative transfer protein TrbJ
MLIVRSRLAAVSAGLALSLANIAPVPAQAQVAVIDMNAIIQAEQQVSQGLTQIKQLEAQVANQAQMLQRLETDVTGPLTQITGQATAILQQAQGLGYNSQNIAQQYQQLYPTSMSGSSFTQTQAALASWRQASSQTLQQAMTLQNQIVQAQPTTTRAVSAAVSASQGAAGQTSAIQATNQLLAAVSAQLTQLQTLLITEARAQQTAAAQAQATQAAGQADSQQFWSTPAPASRVQNPGQM